MNGFALYVMALAGMICVYSLYLKYAVPAIEGPPVENRTVSIATPSDLPSAERNKDHLVPLLPENAWELADCKTLITPSGTIMFKTIEDLGDGKIKVEPCSLLTTTDPAYSQTPVTVDQLENGAEAPFVLRTVEGALLKFDKPMSEVIKGKANLENARLLGQVDVYRPADEKHGALHVITSNVQVEKDRIYTIDWVTFAFGLHQGRGKNMLIDLAHTPKPTGQTDFSTIVGVRQFELAFLEKLQLQPSEIRKMRPVSTGKVNKKKLFTNDSPILVSCAGAFIFDVINDVASFNDTVVAKRDDAFGDTITCDKLLLKFAEETAQQKDGATELEMVIAEGNPASIRSNSAEANVTGHKIVYDVNSNMITGQTNSLKIPFQLVTPEFLLTSEQLNYQIIDGPGFGPIKATGQGKLVRMATQGEEAFFVRWSREFNATRDPAAQSVLNIKLDGDAFAQLDADSHVSADKLTLQLKEVTTAEGVDSKSLNSKKRQSAYFPIRMTGTNNVKIKNPEFEAESNSLKADWINPRALSSRKAIRLEHHVARMAYRGSWQQSDNLQPLKKIGRRPPIFDSNVRPVAFEGPTEVKGPVPNLKGESIEVTLMGQGNKTDIRDLFVKGNVDVRMERDSVRLLGDELKLVPQSKMDQFRIEVTSRQNLASVNTKEFELSGKLINLDQKANKIWVDGLGRMKTKASKDQQLKGDKLESLDCRWAGGMIFDGQKLYFEHDVAMSITQRDREAQKIFTETQSEAVRVELKKRMDLSKLKSQRNSRNRTNKFELVRLLLVDRVEKSQRAFSFSQPVSTTPNRPVNVATRTLDSSGKLVEEQSFKAPKLIFNAVSGKLNADGPGLVTMKTRIKKQGNATPIANLSKKKSPIAFIQISFDDSMDASTNQKEFNVTGNVHTIYKPLDSMSQKVGVITTSQRADGIVHLQSERLQIAQWEPQNAAEPTNEIIATGNARMFSEQFEASADRVSYSQLSDVMTIEGTPRNDANLWFRQVPSDPNPTHLIAEKITYRLKDQFTQTDGVKNLNLRGK